MSRALYLLHNLLSSNPILLKIERRSELTVTQDNKTIVLEKLALTFMELENKWGINEMVG